MPRRLHLHRRRHRYRFHFISCSITFATVIAIALWPRLCLPVTIRRCCLAPLLPPSPTPSSSSPSPPPSCAGTSAVAVPSPQRLLPPSSPTSLPPPTPLSSIIAFAVATSFTSATYAFIAHAASVASSPLSSYPCALPRNSQLRVSPFSPPLPSPFLSPTSNDFVYFYHHNGITVFAVLAAHRPFTLALLPHQHRHSRSASTCLQHQCPCPSCHRLCLSIASVPPACSCLRRLCLP